MTLRKKTLFIVALTAGALIIILAVASQLILMQGFERLEQQAVQKDVSRVLAAVTSEEQDLSSRAADWAAWDDTYRFVTDRNGAFEEANLGDDTFVNLDLSLMLLFNASGQLVFGKAFDWAGQAATPLPPGLDSYVASIPGLLHHEDAKSSVVGVALLPDGPVLLVSRPIITSRREGPIRGTLVMARSLDARAVDRLSQRLLLPVQLRPVGGQVVPADLRSVQSDLTAANSILVRPLNGDAVAGYALLNDTSGRPALVVRVDQPRAIYRQGQTSIAYFVLSLLLVGVVFAVVTVRLLEEQILHRVTALSRRVESIGAARDLSARVAVTDRDELSSLADSINGMLQQLELAQAALRHNEDQLRASESNYRSIFDSANDAIFVHDAATGRIVDLNEEALRAYGWTRAEAVALSFGDLCASESPHLPVTAVQRLLKAASGVPQVFEWMAKDKGGQTFWAEMSLKLVTLGGQPRVLSIVRDITSRKRLEANFLQAQKMETIGRLAGGVAHDFNNLLTAISGFAALARKALPPGDPAVADIDQILKNSGRAAGLTRQLLAFSRRQVIAPQVLNPNALVLDMDKMLRRLIGEDIELTTVPGAGVGTIRADRVQMEQVLINLAVNARDAMPHGGKLTIETAAVRLDGAQSGDFVMLAVSDTGVGMSTEVKDHVFEPFFTTKEIDKGTGLGLATVYGIVKQHNGEVTVDSELGLGTTFKIYLPCFNHTGELEPRRTKLAPRGGHETVLIVEDEQTVRTIAGRILNGLGYATLEASNGADALKIAADHPADIQLLLTDIVMPQMNGHSLAEQLKRLRPDLRILYMSGYAENVILRRSALDPGVSFLPKPFSEEAMATRVREVLDHP
jgi:two-component system, cell cycle sensor histidine kinase and response regulator CckA